MVEVVIAKNIKSLYIHRTNGCRDFLYEKNILRLLLGNTYVTEQRTFYTKYCKRILCEQVFSCIHSI